LLRQVGIEPATIAPADVDESPRPREVPRDYALRMARAKADAVASLYPHAFVLAADTVVALGRRILPKPPDAQSARRCLTLLSGRRHKVFGGIVSIAPDSRRAARVVATAVAFKRLHGDEIDAYLASGEWRGKAGGYGIQGRAAALIPWINGSYTNVVGLPVAEAVSMLRGLGYRASGDGS